MRRERPNSLRVTYLLLFSNGMSAPKNRLRIFTIQSVCVPKLTGPITGLPLMSECDFKTTRAFILC